MKTNSQPNSRLAQYLKIAVGCSWLLGIVELIHPVVGIPTPVVWGLVIVSLVLHLFQSIYFIRKYSAKEERVPFHVCMIMIFGMPHLVSYHQKLQATRHAR